MRILTLLEKAKFAKEKMVAYHGTDIRNLHSILKNGLLKNHGETGLGRGEHSDLGFSFDPHEGVYATAMYPKAVNFAKDVAGEENSLVVVLQVQKKGINLDEDEIFSMLKLTENMILGRIEDIRYIDDEYELDEKANEIIDDIHHEAMKNLPEQLRRYNVKEETIEYLIRNANEPVRSMIREIVDSNLEYREADIRSEQEKLLKLFKHAVRSDMDSLNIFQIPAHVGFRGANKIVGFIAPHAKKAWGAYIPQGFTQVRNPRELIQKHPQP